MEEFLERGLALAHGLHSEPELPELVPDVADPDTQDQPPVAESINTRGDPGENMHTPNRGPRAAAATQG
jgi:hypothetical protein